jgi:hypothetical protein
MAFIVGERYPAHVADARFTESSQKGTAGIAIRFDCGAHGNIGKRIWLTREGFDIWSKELKALGATDEQLKSGRYYRNIGEFINGVECEVVAGEEDDGNGGKRVCVKFINAIAKSAREGLEDDVANIFASMNPAAINNKYSSSARASSGPPPDGWEGPSDAEVPPEGRKRY